MPQPRHTLRQIGCGNRWHQRSAGTADVPMPDDLEWPRRVIVGAIVVIGVARLATFAEGRLATFAEGPAWSSPGFVLLRRKKRPPKGGLAVRCAGQNSFGIKLCPARSDRKLTIIQRRAAHNYNFSPEMECTCGLGTVVRPLRNCNERMRRRLHGLATCCSVLKRAFCSLLSVA
jgi:hypothetical protein